jgi:hypothetical protein
MNMAGILLQSIRKYKCTPRNPDLINDFFNYNKLLRLDKLHYSNFWLDTYI